MHWNDWILGNELPVRLSFFLGIFAVMAAWEILSSRRQLTVSKGLRWTNNLGLVFLNTLILRILFPTAAVGVALLAQTQGWGLLNYYELPFPLSVVIAVVAMDFVIWLQHVVVHATPALWRLHRVHHSVHAPLANSNFGFNLPCWDRLFGTYAAQPPEGHTEMEIGLDTFRDPKQVDRLPGMLMLPFARQLGEYPINRRW